VIENLAGAGGTIGSTRGAKSAPDGYTMVSGNLGSHGASYSYYPKLGYAPEDFAGVGMVAGTPTSSRSAKPCRSKNLPISLPMRSSIRANTLPAMPATDRTDTSSVFSS